MIKGKRKILILVEGSKPDVVLMNRLLSIYHISIKYEIVSYCTNIYTLYHEMFEGNDPSDMDLLQVLKSREPDSTKKILFDDSFSDILLIFDLDPQAPEFTSEKIDRLTNYFVESSDMGKLYINYPMVEAFYHMKSIPDYDFDSYYATLDELRAGKYKTRVNQENRNHDYRKFATTKEECTYVIDQNIHKAWQIVGNAPGDNLIPSQAKILCAQIRFIQKDSHVAVLSTCAFFIPEYNPALLR